MKKFLSSVTSSVREEEGASAVEYAILVALIAAAVVVTVLAVGIQVNALYETVKNCLITPATCPASSGG